MAIIGAGNLRGALGRELVAAGHVVTFGEREPKEGAGAVTGGLPSGARVAGLTEAASDAEVVILATPAGAVAEAVGALGAALNDKVIVDATNPVGAGLQRVTGPAGESRAVLTAALLRRSAPTARVVKSFNQVGANIVGGARTFSPEPVKGVAGDDADARRIAMTLAADFGFDPVDTGALVRARELDRLAMLWICLSVSPVTGLGRGFAFALVRR